MQVREDPVHERALIGREDAHVIAWYVQQLRVVHVRVQLQQNRLSAANKGANGSTSGGRRRIVSRGRA